MTLKHFVHAYFATEPEFCVTFDKNLWPPANSPPEAYCKSLEASFMYNEIN